MVSSGESARAHVAQTHGCCPTQTLTASRLPAHHAGKLRDIAGRRALTPVRRGKKKLQAVTEPTPPRTHPEHPWGRNGMLGIAKATRTPLRAPAGLSSATPLRSWLDSWAGIGHVAAGMHRQGYDLQLTQYDERGWRATFYTTGTEHSPTSGRAPRGSARRGARRSGRCGRR